MAREMGHAEHPRIDSIACPWLIRRFVDADAEFLCVPTDQVFSVAAETLVAVAHLMGDTQCALSA